MESLLSGIAGLLGFLAFLVVALVVVVVFFAFRKPRNLAASRAANGSANKNAAGGRAPSGEEAAVLSRGRSNIMEIRKFAMRVKNPQVRQLSDGVCNAADKVMRELKEQPQHISQARQFLNYYLPTLASILAKYSHLEESGVPADDATERTVSLLKDVGGAMDKLYEGLFDDDKLNLDVEIETLTLACKRDGLIVGEEFTLDDGGKTISLTL